jgi:hypothetical protein
LSDLVAQGRVESNWKRLGYALTLKLFWHFSIVKNVVPSFAPARYMLFQVFALSYEVTIEKRAADVMSFYKCSMPLASRWRAEKRWT